MEKLERSAVRNLLMLSRDTPKHFTALGEVERWEPTEPLQEVSLNASSKPPRPLTKRPRRPQRPTPEPKPPTPDLLPALVEVSTQIEALPIPTEDRSIFTAEEPVHKEESARGSRRASVDLSVVQMPPPIQKPRRALQSWRNTPISVAPITRPVSLSVKEVQRALSENSKKYGLRTSSHERKLINLRGKLSFRSYVALKS